MRFIFNLIIVLTLVTASSYGQTVYSLGDDSSYISGLEEEAKVGNDSVKAYTYCRIALAYKRSGDLSAPGQYLAKAKTLLGGSAFLQAAFTCYETLALYLGNDLPSLEKNLIRSDSLLRPFTLPEADKLRAMIWTTYGTVQQIKGNEKEAMDVFTKKAAPFASRSGDFMVQGRASKSIAIVFMNANQRTKAAPYLLRAIAATEKAAANSSRTIELVETYIIAAENYVYDNKYDSGKWLLDKAKEMLLPYPRSNLYLIYYFAEGSYFDKTHQYALANQSFEKGIGLAKDLNAILPLNRLKYARYKTLYNQHRYDLAAEVLLDLIKSPQIFTADKKKSYKELYTTYAKLGNSREAFHWAQQYITLSDSLNDSRFQKDIIELEKKYQQSEQLKRIAVLNAEKQKAALESRNAKLLAGLLGTLSVTLLIAVLSGVVLFRNSKKLSAQKELQYTQRLQDAEQKQQIQVTKALMQGSETERKRLAVDLHDGLGSRLAGVKIRLSQLATIPSTIDQDLAQVIEQLDVSSNELRRIARNLMPEVLLKLGLETALKDMCDSLSTEKTPVEFQAFGIGTDISEEIEVNIYRIVQELVLNAVRHANANQILVQCSQNQSMFFITIEDDGRGFNVDNEYSTGIGLSNIRKRVEYLKGKIETNSVSGEGTTINIEFDVAQH